MDEFWVCQHCKSLNRFGTGKCYGCKNRFGSKPPEVETLKRAPGAPSPLAQAAPAMAAAPTMPSVGPSPAPYLARPVALGPILAAPRATPRRESRSPHPMDAARRRVSLWLALRPSVPVAWLGYLTAVLLTVAVVAGAVLVMNLTPAIGYLLQYLNMSDAWGRLTASQQSTVQTLAVAVAVLGILSLLCFSVFLGLSTHNATGLGADQPLLTPYWAGRCWTSALWAQTRIVVGLVVPALIIWKGYTIPGLIAMIVAVEIAQRHMDDPLGWLTRPARHLPDLYSKLGTEGSIASPLASLWSISFRVANLLLIAVAAVPVIGLAVYAASSMSGRTAVLGWQAGSFGLGQLGIAVLMACLVGVAFGSLAMLVPITVGLVRRQQTRKTLVRVGRSRSWVARPGEGYALAAARGDPFGEDPDDRIVERTPRYGEPEEAAFGGSTQGNPGFGGQAPGGSFGGPAQNPGFGGPLTRGPFGGVGGPLQGGPGFGGPNPSLAQDGLGPGSPDSDPDSELIG